MNETKKSHTLLFWSLPGFVVLCFAAVLVVSRGDLTALKLHKEQADFWDVLFKGVGGVVGIVGGGVALSKLLDERAKENHTEAVKAREPFVNKRQDVYDALVTTTANISTHDLGTRGREKADEQFWTLFWGPLPMVADNEVGAAVNRFHIILTGLETKGNQEALRNASMELARVCRRSLGFNE